jgi:hypothetical protein
LPIERFLVTYARNTLINVWDALENEISERVHSLGWAGQEEEIWWKIGIVIGNINGLWDF